MEILTINTYLSFAMEKTRKGYKITCLYDGSSIGYKDPCRHIGCVAKFIAEMTLAAEEMHRFEKAFDIHETVNQN